MAYPPLKHRSLRWLLTVDCLPPAQATRLGRLGLAWPPARPLISRKDGMCDGSSVRLALDTVQRRLSKTSHIVRQGGLYAHHRP